MTKTKTGAKRDKTFTAQVYTFLETHFYLILSVLLIVGLVFFHPSFTSKYWSWQRNSVYQQFITQVQNNGEIKAQDFWQFREFYSPGEFTYNPESVGVYQALRIIALPHPETTLMTFTAPQLQSTDSIIESPASYENKVSQVSQPLFQNDTSTIWQSNENEVSIIFYKTIDEMMTANGFYDYQPAERALLQGKYWLNQTTLTRN